MTWAFWISAAIIVYTYAGYAAYLWLLAKIAPKPIAKAAIEPSVSVVMAVHNEALRLPAKLETIAQLDYPKVKIEIVITSDGSTDGTNDLLKSLPQVKSVICAENRGKAAALNAALAQATGEIVLFTDARQSIEPQALRELMSNFADPQVGCVSGELMFVSPDGGESGVSLYWRLEKVVRSLESRTGSVVGATGAIYVVRRALVPTLPVGTLLDDVFTPLNVARQRSRVVFEPKAKAWDEEPSASQQEFRRKVRTLAGNYQLVQLAPWTLSPGYSLFFRLMSHKLLRLLVPFLLILNFALAWALSSSYWYLAIAILQSMFYLLGGLGLMQWWPLQSRLISAAGAFCVLNAAALTAFFSFVRHRRSLTNLWAKGAASETDQHVTAEVVR